MTREEAIEILKENLCSICAYGSQDMDSCDICSCDNRDAIKVLEQEPKTGHCKDCRWWKDSDGIFRRGIDAESQCPMNRKEVYEGNGYCFMFEPQESEDKEEETEYQRQVEQYQYDTLYESTFDLETGSM